MLASLARILENTIIFCPTEQTDEIIPAFINITTFSKFLSVLFCVRSLDSLINYSFIFMNSVFEKALLSLLFYTPNHSFIAHDFFFFKTFIPILFAYFKVFVSSFKFIVSFLRFTIANNMRCMYNISKISAWR